MFRSAQVLLAAAFGLVAATVAAEAQNGPGPGQNPLFDPPRFDDQYQAPQFPRQLRQFFQQRFGRQFAPGPFAYRYRFPGPQGGQNAPYFNGPNGGPNLNPPNNNNAPGPFAGRGPRGPQGGQNAPYFNGPNGGPNLNPPNNNQPGPFAGRGPRGQQNGPQTTPPNNNLPGPFVGPGPRGQQNGPQAIPPNNNLPGPFAGPGPRGQPGGQPPNLVPPNANPPAAAGNRGWLGVSIQPLDSALADALRLPSTNGALVADVQAGSPAAAAGIKAGDVITAVDGRAVGNDRDLVQILAGDRPNTQVNLSVWRQGAQASATVTLGTAPGGRAAQNNGGNNNPPVNRPANPTPLGITLSQNPGRDGGVAVMSVTPDSAAARAGVVAGDQIVAVGDTMVSSNADVARAIDAARQSGAKTVLMRLRTDGQGIRFVAIALG